MPLLRWLSVLVFISLLAACGGGGSLDSDSSDGDDGTTVETNYVVSVQGLDQSVGRSRICCRGGR